MSQKWKPGKDQPGPSPLRKRRPLSGGLQPGKEERKSGTPLLEESLGRGQPLLPTARRKPLRSSGSTKDLHHHHQGRSSPPLPPHQSSLLPLAPSELVQGA